LFQRGNHCDRIEKYLSNEAPELASLEELKLENLLDLKGYDIEYIPGDLKIGDLVFIHGSRISAHSGMTAKKNLDSMGIDVICGHIHRIGLHYKTTWQKEFVAIENGTMANLSQDYVGGDVANWQQGFTVINYNNNEFWPEIVHIRNGVTMFRGRLYESNVSN